MLGRVTCVFLEQLGTAEWYYTRAPTIPHITRSNCPPLISEWFSWRRAGGVRMDPMSGNAVIKWPFFLAMIKDARLDYTKTNRTTTNLAAYATRTGSPIFAFLSPSNYIFFFLRFVFLLSSWLRSFSLYSFPPISRYFLGDGWWTTCTSREYLVSQLATRSLSFGHLFLRKPDVL